MVHQLKIRFLSDNVIRGNKTFIVTQPKKKKEKIIKKMGHYSNKKEGKVKLNQEIAIENNFMNA